MPKAEPTTKRYPSKDEAKKLFMDSPYYTWAEFAYSMGWDPKTARSQYPVVDWINEKIEVQNEVMGSEIDGMMAQQSEHWYREVAKTIVEYPKMIDSAAQIVKYRQNQYLKTIQDDLKNGTHEFKKISNAAIRHLTQAVKTLAEAKYASLMLNELKVKEFEGKADGSGKIVFEIAGGGSVENIKKIMEDWNNK